VKRLFLPAPEKMLWTESLQEHKIAKNAVSPKKPGNLTGIGTADEMRIWNVK